jgi:hypothetical protein
MAALSNMLADRVTRVFRDIVVSFALELGLNGEGSCPLADDWRGRQ